MPEQQQKVQLLAQIGPFKGLDATTDPLYVSPNNALDCINFVPWRRYGAFTLSKGRILLGTVFTYPITSLYVPRNQSSVVLAVVSDAVSVAIQTSTNVTATTVTLPAGYTFSPVARYFWQFAELLGFVFMTNGADRPLKVVSNVATNWQINPSLTAPTIGALTGGTLNGVYYWRYTYYNANALQESSPSPVSNTAGTVAANQQVPVSWAASTDAQVTHVNLYRLGGTLPSWVQTAQIAIGTTTYTDNNSDATIVGATLVLHRDPPAAFTAICAHKGRLWGFGYPGVAYPFTFGPNNAYVTTPAQPSDLWFSRYLEPWSFDAVNNVIPLDRVSTGNTPDQGVALASTGSVLCALKSYTFWVVYGDTEQDFRAVKAFDIGCSSANTVASAYGYVFWMDYQNNVWMFDGNTPQNISEGDETIGGIKRVLDASVAPVVFNANVGRWIGFIWNRCYFITNGTVTYGYYIPKKVWFKLSFGTLCIASNPGAATVYAAQLGTLSLEQWFFSEGDYAGGSFTTYGTALYGTFKYGASPGSIQGSWVGPEMDSGAPQSRKRYRYIVAEIPPGDPTNSVSIMLYVDGQLAYTSPPLTSRLTGMLGYFGTVIGDGPMFYTRMDELGFLSSTVQSVGLQNYGSAGAISSTIGATIDGAIGLLSSDPNAGMGFRGNAVALAVANSPVYLPGSQFSVECWMRMGRTWSVAGTSITALNYGDQTAYAWSLRKHVASGGITFGVNTASGIQSVSFTGVGTPFMVGELLHVVGTYDGVTLNLYINGALAATAVPNSPIVDNSGANGLGIGAAFNDVAFTNAFSGTLDEVAIYPTALTGLQVGTHYQAGILSGTSYQIGNSYYRLSLPPISGYRMNVTFQATQESVNPLTVQRISVYGEIIDEFAPVATNPNGST